MGMDEGKVFITSIEGIADDTSQPHTHAGSRLGWLACHSSTCIYSPSCHDDSISPPAVYNLSESSRSCLPS
jgi:hypothetical protein